MSIELYKKEAEKAFQKLPEEIQVALRLRGEEELWKKERERRSYYETLINLFGNMEIEIPKDVVMRYGEDNVEESKHV